MANKRKGKNKNKYAVDPSTGQPRREPRTMTGYGGVSRDTPGLGTGLVAAAFKSGIFRPKEVDALPWADSENIGSTVYRSSYYLHLGLPGAANAVQVKFLEPLVNTYFSGRGGDKLDATARQNFFDRTIKAWDLLHVLHGIWQESALLPKLTRSDTQFGVPLGYSTWESLMDTLEKNMVGIPVLAANLAALTTPVIQWSAGQFSQNKRPSYMLFSTPHRAYSNSGGAGTAWPTEETEWTGSIMDIASSIISEYDSKVFENQSLLPVVSFNRRMIERMVCIPSISNIADCILAAAPCAKDVSNVETEYATAFGATTNVVYNPQHGPPSDWHAAFVPYRVASNVNGGVWRRIGIPTDRIAVSACNGLTGTSFTPVTLTNLVMLPQWDNLAQALGQTTYMAAAYRVLGMKQIATPFPSEDAWNLRWQAWANSNSLITKQLSVEYRGYAPCRDVVTMPAGGGRNGPTVDGGTSIPDIPTPAGPGVSSWETVIGQTMVLGGAFSLIPVLYGAFTGQNPATYDIRNTNNPNMPVYGDSLKGKKPQRR